MKLQIERVDIILNRFQFNLDIHLIFCLVQNININVKNLPNNNY